MKTRLQLFHSFCALVAALTLVWAVPLQAQSTAPPAASANDDSAADVPPNPFGPKPEPSDDDKAAAKAALSGLTVAPTSAPAGSRAGTPARPRLDSVTTEVRQLLLQRFDKNGAGTLNAAEIEEARKVISGRADIPPLPAAQVAQAAQGPLFGLRALIIRRFDKNGDGTLDPTELAALRSALGLPAATAPSPAELSAKEDLAALRQDIIKHFNADGTGQLTDAEKAAAKTWLQQVLAELDKPGGPSPQPSVPLPSSPPPAVKIK